LTGLALVRLLPVAPRPETYERLSSWLARMAAIYGLPAGALLAHCGLAGADPLVLEKGLGAGEGALLAERTGLRPEAIEAMTFRELTAPAHGMIARGDRGICPLCAKTPAIRRRDAALPWGFWCAVHGLRRRPLGGEAIETLFGAAALTALDPLARRGAGRLGDWAAGRDDATPSVPDLLAFVTAPHRRPSPPQLHEQPRLSLEARRAYRGFLEFPIARQALLAVVPEYDRIAPPLAKPVRAGLQGLEDGSLLQNFALAAPLARLTLAPVDYAAASLAAGDEEGRERLRAAFEAWPAGLRRRVHARFRALAVEKASARARFAEPKDFARRPVSRTSARVSPTPLRLVSGTLTRNLTIPAPNRGPRL
jgi:TniQ